MTEEEGLRIVWVGSSPGSGCYHVLPHGSRDLTRRGTSFTRRFAEEFWRPCMMGCFSWDGRVKEADDPESLAALWEVVWDPEKSEQVPVGRYAMREFECRIEERTSQ